MKVTLAVPYEDHAPDATIDVDDVVGRNLIRDGHARRPAAKDEDPQGPPPRIGRGSSEDAWKGYAAQNGVNVADGASKADIVASLEAAGVPVD